MIDFQKIWTSINTESKNSSVPVRIARKIPSVGMFSVFLATDFHNNQRLLYIKLNRESIEIKNLPVLRGLDISIVTVTLGDIKDGVFLKIAQTIPDSDDIFEMVISDICSKVIEAKTENGLIETLSNTLHEWKIFFEKIRNEILPVSKQKGLVAELYFLKDHLLKKYTYAQAMTFWTGSDNTNHDFQLGRTAVEVKATSSKQHRKFTVSSERQLDGSGLSNLYLAVYLLNTHFNMPEGTIPLLINEILQKIHEDSIAVYQFQLKLVKYGYNPQLAEQYSMAFSVLGVRFFNIVDGFPRVLQSSLPDGVGDLKYSVVLSACGAFEIKNDFQNLI